MLQFSVVSNVFNEGSALVFINIIINKSNNKVGFNLADVDMFALIPDTPMVCSPHNAWSQSRKQLGSTCLFERFS